MSISSLVPFIVLAAVVLIPLVLPRRKLLQMPWPIRIFTGLGALAVMGFCAFGFLATFEPLDPVEQWTFRVLYSLGGVAALGGALRLFLAKPETTE